MDPKNSKKPEEILNGGNSTYLEYLQNMYLRDPKSVDDHGHLFLKQAILQLKKHHGPEAIGL